jgi:hypothetical protein
MSFKSCPQVELLEGREVPAAGSFVLSDGTTGSLQFSTPDGVDPGQASQSLPITDLTFAVDFRAPLEMGPVTADYAYGELVGVTGTATCQMVPSVSLTIADGNVTLVYPGNSASGTLIYDGADTQATFDLGTPLAGVMSYDIPWDQVDPAQASQSLSLSNFNLNIAGQNLREGSANFTTAPTANFSYGEFTGLTFAINTSGLSNFPYTSVSMSGLTVTAQPLVGQAVNVTADVPHTMLSLDFKDVANTFNYSLKITVRLADGTSNDITITIESGTTAGGTRDAVLSALQDLRINGKKLDVEALGDTRLKIKGTDASDLKEILLDGAKDPNTGNDPGIVSVSRAARISTTAVTPKLFLNGKEK